MTNFGPLQCHPIPIAHNDDGDDDDVDDDGEDGDDDGEEGEGDVHRNGVRERTASSSHVSTSASPTHPFYPSVFVTVFTVSQDICLFGNFVSVYRDICLFDHFGNIFPRYI